MVYNILRTTETWLGSWLCDELESQNKFGFVSDLELGQHVLWLCDELEN